jgi:hypothetical protein
MDTSGRVALLTAIVAGVVALVGYYLTQATNRHERKSKLYAEALATVREYEELPFRIRRRPSSDPATRASLGEQVSSTFTKLGFYIAYLQIDSVVVGDAYYDLFKQTSEFGGRYREEAWKARVISNDEEMSSNFGYLYDNSREQELCLLAMRRQLSIWGFLSRRSVRRDLTRQRQVRADERPSPE